MSGSTVFLFPDNPVIRTFAFDITKVETHNFVSTLTKNPIEDGTTTTDQVVVDPASFSCTVGVTNTPIETTFEGEGAIGPILFSMPPYPPSPIPLDALASALGIGGAAARPTQAQGFKIGNPTDRIKRMLDRLNILRLTVQTMTVLTSKHQYDNMVLTTISLPIEKVNYAEFTLTFEELIVVTTDQVTAPKPKEPRGAPTTNAGATDPLKAALGDAEKMFSNFFAGKTSILRAGAIAAGG
jgi:hypothetical protein